MRVVCARTQHDNPSKQLNLHVGLLILHVGFLVILNLIDFCKTVETSMDPHLREILCLMQEYNTAILVIT